MGEGVHNFYFQMKKLTFREENKLVQYHSQLVGDGIRSQWIQFLVEFCFHYTMLCLISCGTLPTYQKNVVLGIAWLLAFFLIEVIK